MLNDVPGYGPEEAVGSNPSPAPAMEETTLPTQEEENKNLGIDEAEKGDEEQTVG